MADVQGLQGPCPPGTIRRRLLGRNLRAASLHEGGVTGSSLPEIRTVGTLTTNGENMRSGRWVFGHLLQESIWPSTRWSPANVPAVAGAMSSGRIREMNSLHVIEKNKPRHAA